MDNSLTATGKIRTTGGIERQLDGGVIMNSSPRLTEGAGGTGIPANPWSQKYHHKNGTHCWYCDREIEKYKSYRGGKPLIKTVDHIIPKKRGGKIPRNSIMACSDCNYLKGPMRVDIFGFMIRKLNSSHPMSPYREIIKKRALKLYNKTSWAHKDL